MGFDFSSLNQVVLDTFADDGDIYDTPRFYTSTGSHDVVGVFDADYAPETLGYAEINKPDHLLTVKTSSFTATGAVKGDTVKIRDITYQIVDWESDVGGMTEISLRIP